MVVAHFRFAFLWKPLPLACLTPKISEKSRRAGIQISRGTQVPLANHTAGQGQVRTSPKFCYKPDLFDIDHVLSVDHC